MKISFWFRSMVLLVLISGVFCQDGWSQYISKNNYNYFDFQQKPYYFGITLATNFSGYRLGHSKKFILNDSVAIAESSLTPGLSVHMITNVKIGEFFDFRFTPGFAFSERNLLYKQTLGVDNVNRKRFESVFFEAPFAVRYKSLPYRDKRMFVVAGLKYSYDVASTSNSRQAAELVKISPHDFQVEGGFGMQMFFDYFIFSPEIKVSQGIGNTLIYNDNIIESRVLEKLLSRVFTISFHFEG
ncbi:type IX secretion/gliding motility protein PorT/SprT [Portibacter marinus]|uniref:type IX secretion/gliding motility protein PorT/SprT n=1 Tax=Portibacter marinus TaxID=2898660 RepID=UPI001F220B64|nr:outer membrane beta-barrel protein [Portibacter marinus]